MQNVSLMDIGPTLLDLAGAEPLPGASGRNFRSLLDNAKGKWQDVAYAEYAEPGSEVACRMVRSGHWKYNYYHGMRPELFNMKDDPGEMTDLWDNPRFQAVQERLHKLVMHDWDPARVSECMRTRRQEKALICNWVKTTRPEEPDPLWFDKPLENWVDRKVRHAGEKPQ